MAEEVKDALEALTKTNEGVVLGLGALAEILQKMDGRFAKADNEDEEEELKRKEEEEEKEEEIKKASLVKEIATLVIKEVTAGLQELGAKKVVDVGGKTKWPMSSNAASEDKETPVGDIRAAKGSEEAQKVIQAMKKEDTTDEAHVPGCKCPECLAKADEKKPAVDESVEYPESNKEEIEKYPEEIKSLAKQFDAISKEYAALKKSLPGLIEKEADDKLKKLGFTKEISNKPTMKSLGVDNVSIVKSEDSPTDNVEALSKLPWTTIVDLKLRAMSGDTDGIPQELLR